MSATSEEIYVRNGRSNSFTTLIVKWETDMLEMEYVLLASGTWKISNKYLIEELTDIKAKNISHPGFDKIFNLENFFTKKYQHFFRNN